MTDAVDIKHPFWTAVADRWELMRDTAGGETTVKEVGTTSLPKPSGFRAQEDGGRALYEAYQKRAQFPEIVEPTIRGPRAWVTELIENFRPNAYLGER